MRFLKDIFSTLFIIFIINIMGCTNFKYCNLEKTIDNKDILMLESTQLESVAKAVDTISEYKYRDAQDPNILILLLKHSQLSDRELKTLIVSKFYNKKYMLAEKSPDGTTAYHHVATKHWPKLLELLLSWNSSWIQEKNNTGILPAQAALECGQKKMFHLIVGQSSEHETKYVEQLMILAIQHDCLEEIIKLSYNFIWSLETFNIINKQAQQKSWATVDICLQLGAYKHIDKIDRNTSLYKRYASGDWLINTTLNPSYFLDLLKTILKSIKCKMQLSFENVKDMQSEIASKFAQHIKALK